MAIKFDIPGKKVAFSAANNATGFSAAASAGATADHTRLRNRDAADQHPMSAITGLQSALDAKADADDIPSLAGYATEAYVNSHHDSSKQDKISDLSTIRTGAAKGATAIQEESDPTVPSWAKAAQKPTYTATEVGAAEAVHRHTVDDIGSFQPLELTLKPNTYVETNGVETHYTGWTSTDFIPVEQGKQYKLYWNLSSRYCGWYKSDQSFLSPVTFNAGTTDVFPPANAAFLRVSNSNAAMATLTVSAVQGLELVKTVNGVSPDSGGNVAVPIPSLDGYATEAYVNGHHDSTKQNVISDLATIRSGAAKGATSVQTETDPTVPSWAKASQKPTYTAAEVGAAESVHRHTLADLDGQLVRAVNGVSPNNIGNVVLSIPSDAHINDLINTALSALDGNGVSY